MVYTYDKYCETLSKEFADDYIKGLLNFDPVITADSMKGMDGEIFAKWERRHFAKRLEGPSRIGAKIYDSNN